MSSDPAAGDATFVVPCLNEAATLGALLTECETAFANSGRTWEIVVADNGSTDASAQIARDAGARVVSIDRRGYGAAVDGGIRAARTPWVVYADADGTYAPADAALLVDLAEQTDADLVLGSRLAGDIADGAMPWIHRHLGTPVLSFLIRRLYGLSISDCNSGIRCVKRSAYESWGLTTPGMEYASAMLVCAAASGARVVERPAALRASPQGRQPYLRTWRDGTRHLLVILGSAPRFFWRLGLALLAVSTLLAIPCQWGPFPVFGRFELFGLHTHAITIVVGFYGALMVNVAGSIVARSPRPHRPPPLLIRLVAMSEEILFFASVGFMALFAAGVVFLLWQWAQVDYHDLHYTRLALMFLHLTVVPVTLVFGLFQARLNQG